MTRSNVAKSGLCALVGAVALATLAVPASAAQDPRTDLLREMNVARAKYKLKPLKMNTTLMRPATLQSRYLADTGRLRHTGADGRPFWVRFYKAGYSRKKAIGENLGMIGGCDARSGKFMVSMWLKSPSHRRNLLSRDFKNVGIAIISNRDCDNTVYATAFGG